MKRVWDLERHGDRLAAIDDAGETLSYAELVLEGRAVADACGGRCLAFCLANNTIGSLVGYVGMLDNGVVPLLLSAKIDETLLDELLGKYTPAVVWMPAELLAGYPGFEVAYETRGFVLARTGHASPELHDDLFLLHTTSGSTGSPKLSRLSYENVATFFKNDIEITELDGSERTITTMPMSYSFCSGQINACLCVGSTILLTGKSLMEREFWDFFKREGATEFAGVPYVFEMLDRLRFYTRDLPTLNLMNQSGGKLPVKLHEKFAAYAQERDVRFIVFYAQCEASGPMTYLPNGVSLEKMGSIGIAVPNAEIELIDEDGSVIEGAGVEGELVYRGANVMMGYAESAADLALGNLCQGLLYTGDMAVRDEDGYYYIVGRKKRFLKVYGNRVGLDEVDAIVSSDLGIECASAGEDDHVVLYITDASKAEAVHALVAERTRLYPGAFEVVVLDEIPKNESGKVLYSKLGQ